MVTETCNCTWPDCPANHGPCCDKDAVGDCNMLGDGIHICGICAAALLNFIANDVCTLMSNASKYIPPYFKSIEHTLQRVFRANLTSGRPVDGVTIPDLLNACTALLLASASTPDANMPLPLIEDASLVSVKLYRLGQSISGRLYEPVPEEIQDIESQIKERRAAK